MKFLSQAILYRFRKIKCRIGAEIFMGKLGLEIDINHLLVNEIESKILTEKIKVNSPLYFSEMVL